MIMSESAITIIYDGGDASRNTIDAKLFGQSLQGLDRMVSDCLIILSQERLPKRGERAPLLLKAREPEAGSYNVPQLLQEASDLLGMGVPILAASCSIHRYAVRRPAAHWPAPLA